MMIIDPYRFKLCNDSDANAFLVAIGTSDDTIVSAICRLVANLKLQNLWNHNRAIYPFVGGTAASHSINLINPSTYSLTFYGGWNHSSVGIQGNGVNTFADTGIPISLLSQNDAHLSVYCTNDTSINTIDLGVIKSSISFSSYLACKLSGFTYARVNTSGGPGLGTVNSDSKGFYIAHRNTNNKITIRKNLDSAYNYNQTSVSPAGQTITYYIGNVNNNGSPFVGLYSDRSYSFASFGQTISSGQSGQLYSIIQDFQTQLGRQV